MLRWRRVRIIASCVALCGAGPALASEPVGQAVLIKTEVRGEGGPLEVNDPVHRDEAIKTSKDGLGQFVFRDGTKLAVGWGSTVVIDKFIFDDSKTVKKLTIKVSQGAFRWISGNSSSSAYQIVTPAGTIGVRGTAFDVNINRNGTTAVVLLSGKVNFCGGGGCTELKNRCDFVIAKRNGDVVDTGTVNRGILKTLGNQRALPFLSGGQQLSGGLGGIGAGCSFAQAINSPRNNTSPPGADPSPARASSPPSPSPPSAPAPQSSPPSPSPAPASAPQASPPAAADPPSQADPGCDDHDHSRRGDHDGGHHSGDHGGGHHHN
ncbi:FecR family protein [Rhizobium tubonense]|uniref:FecR protein domain-containing protein n=1 Tax=Rhizobium tubonense TaxID=484088 RepID=A0A2W4CEG1_9HYPH|nr:FecR domain-containing protein [Rhizobium tubonense]PZM11211.1 hypothetical protein CPY51_20825 [Rhizobium tubonense]